MKEYRIMNRQFGRVYSYLDTKTKENIAIKYTREIYELGNDQKEDELARKCNSLFTVQIIDTFRLGQELGVLLLDGIDVSR